LALRSPAALEQQPTSLLWTCRPWLRWWSSPGSRPAPDGQSVPADRLVEALLVDSYAEAGAEQQEQQVRREALRAAAGTAAAGLLSSDVDLAGRCRSSGGSPRGRHLW
jgi:hypothetical protein